MELSPLQQKADAAVTDWYFNQPDKQVFRLFGYAGTGKSTIASKLLERLNAPFASATFTGKAASVLRRKGLPHTTTVHKLIYTVRPPDRAAILKLMEEIAAASAADVPDMKAKLIELNRPVFDRINSDDEDAPINNVDLIVIDECSMVDEEMGRDLESFGVKILVLGDPFQLPPIKGQGYFTDAQPDFLLTEIHRQAADNPIIKLATDVRSGNRLRYGVYGSSVVKSRTQLSPRDLMDASQILVGRNATRRGRNTLVRSQLKRSDPLPVPGDRVICLKNDNKLGLLNGVMYEVVHRAQNRWVEMQLRNLDDPEAREVDVFAHEEVFLGKELNEMPYWLRKLAQEFDYAYAITVHKAQGSQWKDVLIENESYCFKGRNGEPDMSLRWLYTGITRAEERVTVVL
jgi:exodeoxyribonuclease-5